MQAFELQASVETAAGEVAQVGGFLAREADGAQGLVVSGEELLGGGRAVPEQGGEAAVDRAGGLGGELLADDGADERTVGVVGASAATGLAV